MRRVGTLIVDAIRAREDPAEQERIRAEVSAICGRFPVPGLPDA